MKKGLTVEEIQQVEQRLKRLQELSEKSLGEISQLVEPSKEQKRWVLRKLKTSRHSWEANKK